MVMLSGAWEGRDLPHEGTAMRGNTKRLDTGLPGTEPERLEDIFSMTAVLYVGIDVSASFSAVWRWCYGVASSMLTKSRQPYPGRC